MIRCQGGWCDWCPVKIQLECEEQRMTPIERIEHIRQCLRRMNPVLGSELAGAAAIEQELRALEQVLVQQAEDSTRYRWLRERDLGVIHDGGVFAGVTPDNVVLNGEDLDAAIDSSLLAEMTRTALNGDTCG